MKSNDLIDIIGEAADEYIQDAKSAKKKAVPRWVKWSSAIAACLVVVIGVGSYVLPRMGSSSSPGSSAAADGHDEGSIFMSYAGPVFPLTLREENSAISAERNITMDFAPWVPVWVSNEEQAAALTNITEAERQDALDEYNEWYPEGGYYQTSGNILVTDAYVITNESNTEQTIHVLYPFTSNLKGLNENRPVLTLNGEQIDAELHVGAYSGEFQGAWEHWKETNENPGTLNLKALESWEGYQELLADGSYLQRALDEFVDLSHIPVTLYELTDAWGPEENNDAGIPNPSIRVMFDRDYENSKVLSYGFNGGYRDDDKGTQGKIFSIRREGERYYGMPYYIIVVGEDINNIQYQGYPTGGWDTKKTIEAGVTITRSETNLEEALRLAASCYHQETTDSNDYFEQETEYSFELYYGLLKEHLMEYGVLSDSNIERYDGGDVENLDVIGVGRVCWLEAEITIPAGESVMLNAVFEKAPSFDHSCTDTENKGISGYDLVTELGSNLSFAQQTAKLEDRGQIEIVRQNFGFDLANGIKEVVLDLNKPHYYLEVKSPEAQE